MSRVEATPPVVAPAAGAGIGSGTGILLLALIALFWGVNWPAMKLAVTEVPIWTFRTICLLAGGLGMLAICRFGRLGLRIPRGELRPLLIVSLFNITGWHLCSAVGILHLSAGRASIIAFTMPLWTTLLAEPMLGERLTAATVAGLVVGLAGMAALVVPEWTAMLEDPLGLIYMLGAALSWAVGTIGLKYFRFTMPVASLTGWQLLIGGIPILLGALWFERGFDPGTVSATGWWSTAYAALIPMIFCHWAWFKLVRSFSAVTVAIGTLAIPVVGVLSSALALGEPLGVDIAASLALVLAALFLVLVLPVVRSRRAGGL